MKIIFVCHGNICRSAMAEYIMKDLLKKNNIQNVEISSAAVSTEEIGSDIYYLAKQKLDEKGIKYSRHYAHQITAQEIENADKIYIMDESNRRIFNRMFGDNPKVKKLLNLIGSNDDVADPWYTRNFDITYNQIYNCCNEIVKQLL